MRILLIEDDAAMARRLERGCSEEGYRVDVADRLDRGRSMARSDVYDAIVLEVRPPEKAGVRICRLLREEGVVTPIILVGPPCAAADVVRGLDAGADDYLAMPFEIEEVLARLRAVLRRSTHGARYELRAGPIVMDLVIHRVLHDGREVHLSPKEFELLCYFMRNPNRVLSQAELSAHVWGAGRACSSNEIAVYVCALRRKLGAAQDLIETVPGYGYRLSTARDEEDRTPSSSPPRACSRG